jgi:hypothetical protein
MSRIASLLMFTCLSLFVGCIERSIVVKVRNDGSGVVHVRSYQQTGSLAFAVNPKKKDADQANGKVSENLPSEESLQQIALQLGDGVRLESVKAASNPQGWTGHEVLFAFDNISNLRLSEELFKLDDLGKEPDAKPSASENQLEQIWSLPLLRFAMTDGTLHITRPALATDPVDPSDELSPTDDPFAKEPKSPAISSLASPMVEAMFAKAMKEARFGLFVQIDGDITETNAAVSHGNQVTLMSIEFGKLIEQKTEMQILSTLSSQYQGEELVEALKKVIGELDGFHLELNESTYVR